MSLGAIMLEIEQSEDLRRFLAKLRNGLQIRIDRDAAWRAHTFTLCTEQGETIATAAIQQCFGKDEATEDELVRRILAQWAGSELFS